MRATCPHCRTDIELLGTTEIKDLFGITPNQVQHSLRAGKFPAPWLKFRNRAMWLKADIEDHKRGVSRKKTESATKMLIGALAGLGQDERERILEEIKLTAAAREETTTAGK